MGLRHWMNSPFRTGRGIVATNDHVAVVVPDDGGDYPDAPVIPDVVAVIDKGVSGTKAYPLTNLALPDRIQCTTCSGTAESDILLDLDGEGCPSCDDGFMRQSVEFSKHRIFDIKYVKMIASLPGATFSPATGKARLCWEGHRFDFDGGYGLLMAMKRPHPQHFKYKDLINTPASGEGEGNEH